MLKFITFQEPLTFVLFFLKVDGIVFTIPDCSFWIHCQHYSRKCQQNILVSMGFSSYIVLYSMKNKNSGNQYLTTRQISERCPTLQIPCVGSSRWLVVSYHFLRVGRGLKDQAVQSLGLFGTPLCRHVLTLTNINSLLGNLFCKTHHLDLETIPNFYHSGLSGPLKVPAVHTSLKAVILH